MFRIGIEIKNHFLALNSKKKLNFYFINNFYNFLSKIRLENGGKLFQKENKDKG